MNVSTIEKYVDNKIVKILSAEENNTFDDVITRLNEGINRFNRNMESKKGGLTYYLAHNEYSNKRISDIENIKSMFIHYYGYSPLKLFNLWKLREKINGAKYTYKTVENDY